VAERRLNVKRHSEKVHRRASVQAAFGADAAGRLAAVDKALSVIELDPDGTILSANENFLATMGYTLSDVRGRHHRMFVDEAQRDGAEYAEFLSKLARGEFQSGEFRRLGKNGREIWIQASYSPVPDANGRPCRIVEFSTDVTRQVRTRLLLRETIQDVARSAETLASSSEDLSAVSRQVSRNAEETTAQVSVVSAAAEQVSKNTQIVATATEEMTSSIKEIAKNTSDAAKVAMTAVQVAQDTNATIAKLGESSGEIGKVIKVITSIAQQTNLLALNATIEAARAGEAGKGFAVVANEVKELAKATAKATEDISQKIEAIQSDTKSAVAAIGEITAIINRVNDIQSTIASAVEEQTATTNEIGRNVHEAATGTSEIASNVISVAQAANSTSAGASDTEKTAAALARIASELKRIVGRVQL
jgi:methyl-accepting chemotaxis protein